jgi:hypothetical protein
MSAFKYTSARAAAFLVATCYLPGTTANAQQLGSGRAVEVPIIQLVA